MDSLSAVDSYPAILDSKMKRIERDISGEAVAACVQAINHTIGELARGHGVAAVVVALTEVMGCSSCMTDSIERGASVRMLVERMSALQGRR
jgi:hypothetical protein